MNRIKIGYNELIFLGIVLKISNILSLLTKKEEREEKVRFGSDVIVILSTSIRFVGV